MRNLGRVLAAFTTWAAAAAACAQPAALTPAILTPEAVAPMTVVPVTVEAGPEPMTATPIPVASTLPPPMVAVPQAVYVTSFVSVPPGAPSAGLLARLRETLRAHAAGRDAELVAQAVVQRLNHAGVAARYLAPGEPAPPMGWLIGGVFYAQDEGAQAPSQSATSANEPVGTDVTVTIADLEHGPDTPFAVIGMPPAQDAQAGAGTPAGWHPYVIPAKLTFEHADRNSAIAALAQHIVDDFVGSMTALRQADARTLSP